MRRALDRSKVPSSGTEEESCDNLTLIYVLLPVYIPSMPTKQWRSSQTHVILKKKVGKFSYLCPPPPHHRQKDLHSPQVRYVTGISTVIQNTETMNYNQDVLRRCGTNKIKFHNQRKNKTKLIINGSLWYYFLSLWNLWSLYIKSVPTIKQVRKLKTLQSQTNKKIVRFR